MAQFAIENLTFSYPTDPEHPSLREISLQVEQGAVSYTHLTLPTNSLV